MNKKRVIGFMVCFSLLMGNAISLSAVGTDSSTGQEWSAGKSMSDAMIAHWDFQGETPEEQLADKSYSEGNGTTNEQLKASATGVKVENGVAIVDGTDKANKLTVSFSGENDFSKLETEMTICMRFAIQAETVSNTGFANYLVVEGNIFRGFLYSFDKTNKTAKLQVRMNPNTSSSYIQTPAGDPAIALDGETWVDVAYTMKVDGNNVLAESYISFDGGVTYAKGTRTIAGVSPKALNSATGITLGGITHDVTYMYDDIKIFNCVLTEEQIKLQGSGAMLHGVQNTEVKDDQFAARFVGSIDQLNYHDVGFHIAANDGSKKWNYSAKTVYESLVGTRREGETPVLNSYSAEDLRGKGAYLFAVSISDIPASGEVVFTVTPYWIVKEGGAEQSGISYRIVFTDGVFRSAEIVEKA